MTNANIIIPEAGRVEIVDRPVPVPKSGEVLVRMVRSTVSSGTERANYIGEVNVNILTNDGVARWPRQGGYSSAGVVEKVGECVKSLKPGDRVAMSWTVHSQYVVVPEENAYLLPENVSFGEGALAHIATFPMAAIRKCGVEMGESAIVMGQGVLGQLAVMLLRCAGSAPIFAADPVAEKRERALKLGADFALDPLARDFAETVKSMTPNPDSAIFKGDQAHGVKVIPTITWSSLDTLEWCFDGEPVGGVVATSSVGMFDTDEHTAWLLEGYAAMIEKLKPTKIIWKGKVPEELADDVASGLIYKIASHVDKWHGLDADDGEGV